MLDVGQYARAVVPRGTLAVVTDLHEIANVTGIEGMQYVRNFSRRLPIDFFFLAPSCIPATHFETSGASFDLEELRRVLRWKECLGLGEMMNFPGVIGGNPKVLDKIELAQERIIDGHAPAVTGKDLTAYIAAGICSDHESITLTEAEEKLRQGMWLMIREASSAKNLETLLPLISDSTYKRCMLVVDDRSCVDLLHDGDLDAVVRKAISLGLNPIRAIQLATINPAEYFRLNKLGAVAPGYKANLIVLNDLVAFEIDMVFYRGQLIAKDRQPLFSVSPIEKNNVVNTMHIKSFASTALELRATDETEPVVELVPDQIITKKGEYSIKDSMGIINANVETDILKMAVIERHKKTGNIGLGLIRGFGLKRGAVASSIAHDSHNIVTIGTNDGDMYTAIKEVEKMGGGLIVVDQGEVLARLALPIAGLLSDEPLESVVAKLETLERAAKELGSLLPSPFATLSFLALPVIPELKLTDLGLVDVNQFKLIK
jgi:adenine deaminase